MRGCGGYRGDRELMNDIEMNREEDGVETRKGKSGPAESSDQVRADCK